MDKKPRHTLLEKQIMRASRFTADGTCDLEALLDAINMTYAEQESLRERHDRASKLMTDEIRNHRDVLQDVVTLRTKDLETAKNNAEKANLIKSAFLANMSHELRTPLNSILGMINMLKDDETLSLQQREMARVVHKSSKNLLETVNDILDISKIEAGSMILEKIGFDFEATLSDTIEALAPIASSKGISLHFSYKSGKLPYLKGDPSRIGRIFTNLISNAIKYTNVGRVMIEIDCRTLGSDLVEIQCSVSDSGIGISDDKLDMIFEKFSQADDSINRKYGGTGLGLAITKDLVEMMNGEIRVTSEVGKGSTFSFRIPFETADAVHHSINDRSHARLPMMDRKPTIPVSDARILVAEDHPLNQAFITKLLENMGLKNIHMRSNGQLALQAYEENDYNIILMDCHMPDINGYQATAEIRKREALSGGHIPVIALTADAMTGTRDKCLAAGMDEYISKPIDAEDVKNVLSCWIIFDEDAQEINQEIKTAVAPAKTEAAPPVDLSILQPFADTQEELQEFIDIFIEQADLDLKDLAAQCTDGENAQWSEVAHKIKGSSATVGAAKLHQLCTTAQNMRTAGLDQRLAIFKDIKLTFLEAKDYLEKTTSSS